MPAIIEESSNRLADTALRLGRLTDPLTEAVTIHRGHAPSGPLDRPEVVEAKTVVEGFPSPRTRIRDLLAESDT